VAGLLTLVIGFGCQSGAAIHAPLKAQAGDGLADGARNELASSATGTESASGESSGTRAAWLSAAAETAEDRAHFSLDASYLYGPAEGFVQTPSGGNPGTTSHHRPKLDEIGIDDASIADAELRGGRGPHELYLGGQWVRLSGDDTLDDDLTSQARSFAAGTSVSSDLKLDWYRAGYRYRFNWDQPDGRPLFSVAPSVGATLLDFQYQLDGGGEKADRSYIKAAPQMGVDAEWHLTDRWSLVGDVLCSLPIPNMPFILKSELAVRYRVLRRRGCDVNAELGVAYEQIHYEDDQQVPNHVEVDLGPLLLVGLEFKF
jgi:hypothetical protein